MANVIKITQRQAPNFRALIKKENDDLFNPVVDLATAEELSQEGITTAPISFTIYRSTNATAPYIYNTDEAEPIPGYTNKAIDADALLEPSEASAGYNFTFTPENRKTFAFERRGNYFVDFLLYPKVGAAVSWRTGVEVV